MGLTVSHPLLQHKRSTLSLVRDNESYTQRFKKERTLRSNKYPSSVFPTQGLWLPIVQFDHSILT